MDYLDIETLRKFSFNVSPHLDLTSIHSDTPITEAVQVITKHVLLDEGMSSLTSQSSLELFHRIVYIAYTLDNPCPLLAALFQLSGVIYPLKIYGKPTLYHTERLSALVDGQKLGAHCLTEVQAGTDSFAMQTTIKQRTTHFEVQGCKTYICNAGVARLGLLYGKIVDAKPHFNELVALLVDLDNPQISLSKPLVKLGLNDIPMANIHFNHVEYPLEALVGNWGSGFSILQTSTTYERLIISLSFIGRMIRIYKQCRDECKNSPSASYALSDIHIIIEVAIAFAEKILKQVEFIKWQRSYLNLGCMLKIHLTQSYIEVIKLAKNILSGDTANKKELIEEEKASLGAWIYSGTNDSLKSMLAKLISW